MLLSNLVHFVADIADFNLTSQTRLTTNSLRPVSKPRVSVKHRPSRELLLANCSSCQPFRCSHCRWYNPRRRLKSVRCDSLLAHVVLRCEFCCVPQASFVAELKSPRRSHMYRTLPAPVLYFVLSLAEGQCLQPFVCR